MVCEFQSLYYGDDGYVIWCKKCKRYQVAFASTLLTLTGLDFQVLCKMVKQTCNELDHPTAEHQKSVVLRTPAIKISMLLTRQEVLRFLEILEEASNEAKTQSLLALVDKDN